MTAKELFHGLDRRLVAVVAALAGIGLVAISSVATTEPALASYPLRQAGWLVVAAAAFLATFLPHYRRFRRLAIPLYVVSIALLLAVDLFGVDANDARRWLAVGGGIRIQPSELAKPAFVLLLARILARLDEERPWPRVLAALALTAVPGFLVMEQPDLGTALLFVPVLLAMIVAAGAPRRVLVALVLAGIAFVPPALFFTLRGYQRNRIDVWVSQFRPDGMDEAMKRGIGYQLHRTKLAIGGGGFFGHGFGEGPENLGRTLPARHTDLAFAVVGEEWGFVGAALVLALFAAFLAILADHAGSIREPVGRLLATGALALFGTQIVVNLGMCVGLLPIVGITPPFVSSGGSSLVSSALLLGLAMNAATRKEFAFEPEG